MGNKSSSHPSSDIKKSLNPIPSPKQFQIFKEKEAREQEDTFTTKLVKARILQRIQDDLLEHWYSKVKG